MSLTWAPRKETEPATWNEVVALDTVDVNPAGPRLPVCKARSPGWPLAGFWGSPTIPRPSERAPLGLGCNRQHAEHPLSFCESGTSVCARQGLPPDHPAMRSLGAEPLASSLGQLMPDTCCHNLKLGAVRASCVPPLGNESGSSLCVGSLPGASLTPVPPRPGSVSWPYGCECNSKLRAES